MYWYTPRQLYKLPIPPERILCFNESLQTFYPRSVPSPTLLPTPLLLENCQITYAVLYCRCKGVQSTALLALSCAGYTQAPEQLQLVITVVKRDVQAGRVLRGVKVCGFPSRA